MATEREMLELELELVLAARAAGFEVLGDEHPADGLNVLVNGRVYLWRPRVDDGDALRLAASLRINIEHNHPADQSPWVVAERSGCEGCFDPVCCVEDEFDEARRGDATRLAIVRAAAEIGRRMK